MKKLNIWKLAEVLQQASTFQKQEDGSYVAIFLTGRFKGVGDYGANVLEVTVRNTRIAISTVDDGTWVAHTSETPLNIKEAISLFNKFRGVLPSEEELNAALQPLGLWGQYVG